ncbi:MAG: SLC13/DASS family transporter [Gemmatimonadales bacterium]|nr:MAG: SLC13/DASS family transporter [Gemmatimonadales bacterium]
MARDEDGDARTVALNPEIEGRGGLGWGTTARWAGPLLFLLLLLPPPDGLSSEGWKVAILGILMATWWVTEAVPLAVTALLPIPLLPLLGVMPVGAAAAPFADPVIFLFMGGFMLATAMQRWSLHRRIAFGIIAAVGTSPRRLVGGFILAAAFLSMWVSNTAVAVMMLPIGTSVIQVVGGGPGKGNRPPGDPMFALALLLGIAYGASVGGVATLIGTPPNALLAGFLASEYDIHIGFVEWMTMGLPLTALTLPLVWLLLTRVAFQVDPEGAALPADALDQMRRELGAISPAERRVAWLFALTALAWMTRPLMATVIPGISDAGIAMLTTILLFLVPSNHDEGGVLLDWDTAKGIPWDILLLFGGGLSLAAGISQSGLAGWMGEGLAVLGNLPLPVLLLGVTVLIVSLTELSSNTAATAAFLPVLAALALSLQVDPLLLTVPAALAASCAFMLPVATPPNAVVFGSRWVQIQDMIRAGVLLNLLFIAVIPLLSMVLLRLFFGVELGSE